jgi:hypothetical protein
LGNGDDGAIKKPYRVLKAIYHPILDSIAGDGSGDGPNTSAEELPMSATKHGPNEGTAGSTEEGSGLVAAGVLLNLDPSHRDDDSLFCTTYFSYATSFISISRKII